MSRLSTGRTLASFESGGSHFRSQLDGAPLTHLGQHLEMRMLSEMRHAVSPTPTSRVFAGATIASKRAISPENALDYA